MSTSVNINVSVEPDDFEKARQSVEDVAEAVKSTVSKSYPTASVTVYISTSQYFSDTAINPPEAEAK